MEQLQKMVVRLKLNHPWGRRNRAWFQFDETAQMIMVNAEQKKIIENDSCLTIITKGSTFKRAEEALKEKSDVSMPETDKNEPSDDIHPEIKEFWKKINKMNKTELIEALIKKGQVEDEDFTKETTNKNLAELLKNL